LSADSCVSYYAGAVPNIEQTMKPKKSEHISATGKVFHGTDAEFFLSAHLPYGRWTLADRREVLFNAFEEPMLQRGPGLPVSAMDPGEVVTGVLWTDVIYGPAHRHHEKRDLAKNWLTDFRNGTPISKSAHVPRYERGGIVDDFSNRRGVR
jgi:hypothetical protein